MRQKNNSYSTASRPMRKLIIDTDCGLDDASAILLALSDPGTQVLAITTVDGNATLDNVVRNVLLVLRAADRRDIPVYRGCPASLLNLPCKDSSEYHGSDGLGDYPHHEPVDTDQVVEGEHAVAAIARLVQENQSDIDIICLGPLTNLGLAVRLNPDLGSRINRLCIMGGNYKGRGNVSMAAEFNFYRDPEAAHIVLQDLAGPCQVTMVGWEICEESQVPYETAAEIMQAGTKKAAFLRNIYAGTMQQQQLPGFVYCDELAVACLLWPEVATQSKAARFRVELAGHWCRGMAVPDWEGFGTEAKQPLVTIVTAVDMTRFLDLMRHCLSDN